MVNDNRPTTSLKSVHIRGLFEIFDYDIKYATDGNVLILTGANGFGKTQVLNIIYSLFNRKFSFFHQLVFSEIFIHLNNGTQINIRKVRGTQIIQESLFEMDEIESVEDVEIEFIQNNKSVDSFFLNKIIPNNMVERLENYLHISRLGSETWFDHMHDEELNLTQVIQRYGSELPPSYRKNINKFEIGETSNNILNSMQVHLIEEQRLFKKVNNSSIGIRNRSEKNQTVMTETVNAYAEELTLLINKKMRESFSISQDLDRTYPRRLITARDTITQSEYDKRFDHLSSKIDKLARNGLHEGMQETLAYNEEDSKALSVYLSDSEKKLRVFDDLLEKLELFTSILNERRFTFKSIVIDKEKGFYFQTDRGKKLHLSDLSSGEQHELVMLYELIFKTSKGILVLIDEPEISLHVTWQKEFLDDLLKIIELQDFQVLLATHSPSIINDRWDLVYTLEKKL